MTKICREKEYIAIIANRLKCDESHPIELGFINVKPDLICNGIAYEIECEDKVHYGIGQALAYQYGGLQAGLIVIINDDNNNKTDQLINFLRWIKNKLNIDIYILKCTNYDCKLIKLFNY